MSNTIDTLKTIIETKKTEISAKGAAFLDSSSYYELLGVVKGLEIALDLLEIEEKERQFIEYQCQLK